LNILELQSELSELDVRQALIEHQWREAGYQDEDSLAEYKTLRQKFTKLGAEYKAMRRTAPTSGGPINTSTSDDPEWVKRNEAAFSLERPQSAPSMVNAKTGETIRCYGPGQRMATNNELSIGRVLQAVGTNNWQHAESEKEAFAMSGTDTSGGHFLVPGELSRTVIDLARSSAVVFGWGARTVEMGTDALTIARQESDPTFEVKAENAAFNETSVTFGAIELKSRTLGAVLTASRELAEDAPNFPGLIEDALRRALGIELDRLILLGNGGSDGVNGLINRSGVGATGSIGGISWEDFHNAAVAIRALNHSPNGIVLHPTIQGDAQILTSGDGTNSAKLWLGPPPSLNGVGMLPTTGIDTGTAIVGDGSKILVGFRTQARVETSTAAGEAFDRHQLKFKITLRFDFGLTHGAAFHVLSGITT